MGKIQMNVADKVVYQIYPKSFQDSNGDGWGDLYGIRNRLDYLAELGVDFLWLTPFFPSPQRDNGYDVADYRAVDPRFGTMEDLEALIAEAAAHGIGLMFDMVFNHTSTAHRTRRRRTGSRSSAARPGSTCPSSASGNCTSSTSRRPTSTGRIPRCARPSTR